MIKNLYSIKDSKVGYGQPFISHSDATAIRELHSAVNSPRGTTMIAECPEDFSLYALGSFNTDTGELISKCEFICNAPLRNEDK